MVRSCFGNGSADNYQMPVESGPNCSGAEMGTATADVGPARRTVRRGWLEGTTCATPPTASFRPVPVSSPHNKPSWPNWQRRGVESAEGARSNRAEGTHDQRQPNTPTPG